MKPDELLQVNADWEVSCMELEDAIGKLRRLDEAINVWRQVRRLIDRLETVLVVAAKRCDAISGAPRR